MKALASSKTRINIALACFELFKRGASDSLIILWSAVQVRDALPIISMPINKLYFN